MNHNFRALALSCLLLASSVLATAQVSLTSTTLSAAITTTDARVITVASATGFVAGTTGLYVGDEFMPVTAVSGTSISVRRGASGTRARTHASGAQVYVGLLNYFSNYDRVGSCTSTSELVLPVVNVLNGKMFNCVSSVWLPERVDGIFRPTIAVTTDSTAAALTYTAAMLKGGLILRDPNGAGRSDVTPTAALLAAAIPGARAGDSFEFTIRNTADAAETITITAGDGATLSGTMTIAQNNTKRFRVVLASATAYTVYSLGTIVH